MICTQLTDQLLLFPAVAAFAALLSIAVLYRLILKESQGTSQMKAIAGYIEEGARAFIKREVRTVTYFIVILAILLYLLLGWQISLGFILGAGLSVLAMIIGMNAATKANVRTVNAARSSAEKSLRLAFRGGGVMGLATVSLNILGLLLLYFILGASYANQQAIHFLVGFGFGASLAALFAQLGGGIYTKAADVGADLVGKVETKIPEDDPRNPAVIADLVGDNVGDCAGRGADLFESSSDNLIAMMILGLIFVGTPFNLGWKIILLPLITWGFGNIVTIIGIFSVKRWVKNNILSLDFTFLIAGAVSIVGFYFISTLLMNDLRFFYCMSLGLLLR